MKKTYNLHSLSDIVSLGKYVRDRTFWGGCYIRKDDGVLCRWQYFWDHLEMYISEGHNKYVIIREDDQVVEFV